MWTVENSFRGLSMRRVPRFAILSALFAAASVIFGGQGRVEAAKPVLDARTAVFAGGCFWCVETDFDKLPGVVSVVSGYAGGTLEKPTYENHTGHVEAVEVTYDPAVVSYRQLVDYHLRHIDPFDNGGQFCDRGPAYRTAIFAADAEETNAAKDAVAAAEKALGKKIVTPVRPRTSFWRAEEYHQDYAKKNPVRYNYYRSACGRDARVKKVWGGAA